MRIKLSEDENENCKMFQNFGIMIKMFSLTDFRHMFIGLPMCRSLIKVSQSVRLLCYALLYIYGLRLCYMCAVFCIEYINNS